MEQSSWFINMNPMEILQGNDGKCFSHPRSCTWKHQETWPAIQTAYPWISQKTFHQCLELISHWVTALLRTRDVNSLLNRYPMSHWITVVLRTRDVNSLFHRYPMSYWLTALVRTRDVSSLLDRYPMSHWITALLWTRDVCNLLEKEWNLPDSCLLTPAGCK